MMLTALILAAGVTVATEAPMPNFYRAPANCREMSYRVVDRYGRPLPIRLADLPKAGAQLLVDRRVDGCRVITVMGPTARDQPKPRSKPPR